MSLSGNAKEEERSVEMKQDVSTPVQVSESTKTDETSNAETVQADTTIKPVVAKTLEREGHCYCGKERNLNIIELLCASCNHWFHESCIGYQLGKLVPFMMNYVFFCKNCSPTGLESFKKNQSSNQPAVKDGS